MIDKTWKLQRYDRKDYTELVEFPVEIVGRDGVVRRYTFEDSIRLYQRRITFAPIRYRDMDLVRAEVGHCRARIEQLRRSYFHRYGWGTPEGQDSAEETFGEFAGELAAFLCRVLRCEGRPEIAFEEVDAAAEDCTTWFVTPTGGTGMLLYVHRFEGPSADRVREAFFGQLKELERLSGKTDGDVERLLAFHHTVDCGFILTGRGNELDDYAGRIAEEPAVDLSPTPFDEVLELIRRGELEAAHARSKELVAEQPWHLNAYTAGAMLAVHLGDPWSAEELTAIGVKYFPEDATLHWYLAAARWVQGRTDEAEVSLRRAVELSPERLGARAALVGLLLQQGREHEARPLLAERPAAEPDDEPLAAQLDRLGLWLRRRTPGLVAGGALVAVGLGLIPVVGPSAIALAVSGAAVMGAVHLTVKREVRAWEERPPVEELARAVKRLQRRVRSGPRIS